MKNMLVKLDHLPRDRSENSKNLWVATTFSAICLGVSQPMFAGGTSQPCLSNFRWVSTICNGEFTSTSPPTGPGTLALCASQLFRSSSCGLSTSLAASWVKIWQFHRGETLPQKNTLRKPNWKKMDGDFVVFSCFGFFGWWCVPSCFPF